MHKSLLPLLACPVSGSALSLSEVREDARGQIMEGRLTSAEGVVYPILGGIPRFVDSDKYVTSFSMQRRYMAKRFDQWTNEKGREEQFSRLTGVDLGRVAGKTFLDAGCGYGRYAAVVSAAGGTVFGVDLSTDSIEASYRYLGERDNVHLVQGDLTRVPFRRDMFDVVYSIGVLHHTPNTRVSFESLVPHVKPGGKIAVWVYAPEDKRFDDVLRLATVHMPSWSVLGVGVARHVIGQSARRVLLRRKSVKVVQDFWPQVMGQYDSLAPKYAYVHGYEEVEAWFRAAGLTDICRSVTRTAVSGTRPA